MQGTSDSQSFSPGTTPSSLSQPIGFRLADRSPPHTHFVPPPSAIPSPQRVFRGAPALVHGAMEEGAARICSVNRANNHFTRHLAPFTSILLPYEAFTFMSLGCVSTRKFKLSLNCHSHTSRVAQLPSAPSVLRCEEGSQTQHPGSSMSWIGRGQAR